MPGHLPGLWCPHDQVLCGSFGVRCQALCQLLIYGQSCIVTRSTTWQLVGKELFKATIFSMQRGCCGHLGTLQPPNSSLTAPGLDHSSRAPLSVLLHTSSPFFSCCLTRYPSNREVSLVCPHAPIQSPPASHPLLEGLRSCSSSSSKFPLTPFRVSTGPALKPDPRTWFVLPSFPCGIATLFLSGADACQGPLWRCQSSPPRAPHKQFHFPPVGQPWPTEERDRSAPGGEIRPQPQVASPTTAGFVEFGHATSLLKTLQHFLLAPGVPQSPPWSLRAPT